MESTKLTALIDGDTLAFRVASAVQHIIEWPTGYVEPFARKWEGEAALDGMIMKLQRQIGFTEFKMFLSCPSDENWRLAVDPSYKSNRKNSVRPLLLGHLKGYLRKKYGAQHLAYLEADDALGIYATDPDLIPGPKVVIGKDKDFKTIPGQHYQLDDHFMGTPAIRTITAREAVKSHYIQALAGDAVDGYPGCPGIGMKRATEIVENPEGLKATEGVVTRGPRKGEKVTKWVSTGPSSVWHAVVCQYEKAGLTEKDALITARLAKILLAGDYNMDTKEITLWEPGKE